MNDLRERGNPDSETNPEPAYVWVQVPIEGQLTGRLFRLRGGKIDTRTSRNA